MLNKALKGLNKAVQCLIKALLRGIIHVLKGLHFIRRLRLKALSGLDTDLKSLHMAASNRFWGRGE